MSYCGKYVSQGVEKSLFSCAECQRIKEQSQGTLPVPSCMANVGVAGESLEILPVMVLSKHFCEPLKRAHVVGDQLYFEQWATVETSRFALAMEVERNEVKDRMANERSQKRGYQRGRKDKYPVVNLIAEIPKVLAMPWSNNLEKLHRSAHWVPEGNFKYWPKDMQQLYMIHGFVKTPTGQKEAITLVTAIMKTRTREMYERLFGNALEALDPWSRAVAPISTEPAALGAFEAVFGPDLTNMYLFHYTNLSTRRFKFSACLQSTRTAA
uniref:Integrase zinc-binding domain-containing protein n=1 Tax=Plectus sambesii TaxID=2011161 RepID=A0A914XDD9_9BILA